MSTRNYGGQKARFPKLAVAKLEYYVDVLDEAKRERAERLDANLGDSVAKGLR